MEPVAQFQPYKDKNITRHEKSDMEVAVFFFLCGHNKQRFRKLILERYHEAMNLNKKRIAQTLEPLYKRRINFADNIVGEVIIKIKMIITETDRNIPELVEEFNTFFGEEVSFFRPGGKLVSPESICSAFKAMKTNSPKEKVKEILYSP